MALTLSTSEPMWGQMSRIFLAQEFDLVYHLAAEYDRWNGEDHYEDLWQTNTIGAKNMLHLQERHVLRMVFFSSAEVYGDYDALMTEDIMDRVVIKQLNGYAINKWGES